MKSYFLLAATADPLQFTHHSQYDPTRAYSEYASYYAASRHAVLAADPDSLHLYRNGIFSENNSMFRVSHLFIFIILQNNLKLK